MPRAPRIEFEGAVYHIMARGNRREPIVFDDDDRKLFVTTLAEVCGRTGWKVFAWVLMDNHYHFVLRTPEPNLVSGMQWFQNAYTRRLNSRHQLWGHLFGGRYRSILIENKDEGGKLWKDYLRTAIDYVHLNPGLAGIVNGRDTASFSYPWSSLSQGYALPPTKRQKWVAVREGLTLFNYKDSTAGRRRYCERLDEWLRNEAGEIEVDGTRLRERLKRGWFWGSDTFREKMLGRLEAHGKRKSRDYKSSPAQQDHTEKRAGLILEEAQSHYGMTLEELRKKRVGDWTRRSVAWEIAKSTSVPHSWIAERLNLKSAANASQQIRRFSREPEEKLPRLIKKWKKSRNVAADPG